MTRLISLLTIFTLCVPLFAINCYENGVRKNCGGGSYCATQVIHNGNSKVSQFCGNMLDMYGDEICPSPRTEPDMETSCCGSDYCNSSKSIGTLFTFIVSCLALFFIKI